MAKRGPKTTPTVIKKAKGNPGKRPLPKKEPQPESSRPRRPTYLGDEAKKIWDYYAPRLEQLNLLTGLDREMLAIYCTHFDNWVKATKDVQVRGTLLEVYELDADNVSCPDPGRKGLHGHPLSHR